jgi:hypothetical protein
MPSVFARCSIQATAVALALLLGASPPDPSAAQSGTGFAPGSRTLFDLDLAAVPIGEFPKQIKLLKGAMSVVMKDGAPMLKASKESEFLVTLQETLPPDFTVEFEVVPKKCCNPSDLMFEGTATQNRGVASAHIVWDTDYLQAVGGGQMYQSPMPEDLKLTTPSVLTEVDVGFDAGTVKLYTNGKRLFTLSDRKFVRGRVLRVFLGGQDGGDYSVHLAKLRVATNTPHP